MSMDHQKLQTALDTIDVNPDISKNAWSRFCEWLDSFHDIHTEQLLRFETYFDFMKTEDFDEADCYGELPVSVELYKEVVDLWRKWSKATS